MSDVDIKNRDIKKATHHVNQNEGLIFERSSPGKKGYRLAPLDVLKSITQRRLALLPAPISAICRK